MRRAYIDWNPRAETLAIIAQVNSIIRAYQADGYQLTLRQHYPDAH